MSPERWPEVERLLDQVLDLPPAERAGFLDQACSGQPTLRAEVERLLQAAEQAGGFLGNPPSTYAAPLVDRLAEAEALTPGTRLGAYEIVRQLGRGGMATVYLARDLRHDRQVALKVLRPELSALLGSERFLHEIRVTANLQHPHILPLFDSGSAEGRLFYVLPYVDGESLRARLSREKQLPIEEAVRIAREVASALGHAHRHGVIHRDIKPENILLQDGTALVADFGIALALREAGGPRLTQTGLSIGTPQYMSPEQATGDRQLDGRSDIYSLGVVLYEMLTGEPPHVGATVQAVIAKLLTEPPMRLRARRETVPEHLDHAVSRALAKLPADRFASAADFARALVVAPVVARPGRPRRWIAVAAGLGAVGLVGVALLTLRVRSTGELPASPLATPIQVTFSGNVQAAAISRDGSRLALATRECDAPDHCSITLSWQDLAGAGALRVAAGLPAIYRISWSPDSRYLLFRGTDTAARYGSFRIAALGGQLEFLGCCTGEFVGTADTVLLTRARPPGSPVVLQLVTASTGDLRDSVVLVRPDVIWREGVPSPDGRWILLLLTKRDLSRTLLVTDRRGMSVDSVLIDFQAADLRFEPLGSGVVLSELDPQTAFFRRRGRLVRVGFEPRNGHLSRPTAVVEWRDGLTSFDASAVGGTVIFTAGPTETSITAMVRVDQSTRYTSRTLARVTGPTVTALIAPDGGTIALQRPVPGGKDQLVVVPFDGGNEVPVSPPGHLADYVWSGSTRLLYTVQESGGGFRLFARDLASRAIRDLGVVPDEHVFYALPDGAVASPTAAGRELLLVAADGSRRRITVSDSTVAVAYLIAEPSGASVITMGWNFSLDSMIVGRLWLADGRFLRLGGKVAESFSGGVWLPNGRVEFVVQEALGTSALYRIDPQGGPLVRVGQMPYGNAFYRMAADGRRAVASVYEPRADVWMVRNDSATDSRHGK